MRSCHPETHQQEQARNEGRTERFVNKHIALVKLLDDHLAALLLVHKLDHLHGWNVTSNEDPLAVHQRHRRATNPAEGTTEGPPSRVTQQAAPCYGQP
eukprot:COSAG03_NODE_10463_length_649_cov_1.649091_1_plen_98_part_00